MANFLDLTTGMPALWAKIKSKFYTKTEVDALIPEIEQSDWDEITLTNQAYIQNKPAIRAGEGENSVLIGQIEQDEDAAVYTLYITGALYGTTFSYTTQDTIPSRTSLLAYGVAHCRVSGTLTTYQYQKIKDIDMTNNVISFYHSFSPSAATATNGELIIYYKYKTASGGRSCSEGAWTNSTNLRGHAEGSCTLAAGSSAHAEGRNTMAFGVYSHAEGNTSIATGATSHAEGFDTVASSSYQHVQGKYNIEDTANTYADIVGNGTSTSARSNAYTLDWSGNGWYAGKVTVGATPTADMDVATKAYVDAATAGISPNLSGLADTNISNPADGQALIYDSTNSKWVNGDVSTEICEIVVTHDENNDTFSIDKTAEEIINAYNQGLNIVAIMDDDMDHIYLLLSEATFGFTNNHDKILSGLTFYSKESGIEIIIDGIQYNDIYVQVEQKFVYFTYDSTTQKYTANISRTHINNDCYYYDSLIGEKSAIVCKNEIINQQMHYTLSFISDGKVKKLYNSSDMGAFEWVDISETGVTETRVNELIAAALAQYGDGDTASYGYTDASEEEY